MGWADDFLVDREPAPWSPHERPRPEGLVVREMFAQAGANGLEVVLADATTTLSATRIRAAWKVWRNRRATPVLLIAGSGGSTVTMCGPVGDKPGVRSDVSVALAERISEAALDEPDHHGATRSLLAVLSQLDRPFPWMRSDLLGLNNVGLLATHELHTSVQQRPDWNDSVRRAQPLLNRRGQQLLKGLGFGVETLDVGTSVLTVSGRRSAVAVFCRDDEPFDSPVRRFDGISPVSRALAVADRHKIDWVILTRASQIRLHAARADTGVGRRGRTETFVELDLAVMAPEQAGYLPLLFSDEALTPGTGTLEKILEQSQRFAADLAHRLRERVYHRTVPALARAVSDRLSDRSESPNPGNDDLGRSGIPGEIRTLKATRSLGVPELQRAYETVMVILFRLLFTAYAEATDLLPYTTNGAYAERSLSTTVRRLLDRSPVRQQFSDESTGLWGGVIKLWRAIDEGNNDWGVPAYDGGLFSESAENTAALDIANMRPLSDAEFGSALTAMLIDDSPEGDGPVDFRSLSVREFGTIYEGLLESRLFVAQHDLTIGTKGKAKGQFVQARQGDQVVIEEGQVHLTNRSGERKASGSYFTKPFAVSHLLDQALEPALANHIAMLDRLRESGDDAAVAARFFDFRCADIAMGSGHFLVAALDRIEARLSQYLVQYPIPAVADELARLRRTAVEALGDTAINIETGSLLRRQVARHCVYGVDINPIAVELARVSIWIHTFVPGLPLSFLDHNFVCGDSVTGVSTLDEVEDLFAGGGAEGLFADQIRQMLRQAEDSLRRLASTSDATKAEIDEARSAHTRALKDVAGARALFDLITAHRVGAIESLPENFSEAVFIKEASQLDVTDTIAELAPVHFPATFSEVFLRDRPGFDCLLGNPPWEEVVADEMTWWGVHLPGIRGLAIRQMNTAITDFRQQRPDLEEEFQQALEQAARMRSVLRAVFSKLGKGVTDMYKAFAWRNWQLIRNNGFAGLVLPRTALQTEGSQYWRQAVLDGGTFRDVATLINTDQWVFDDVHAQYKVALIALHKTAVAGRHIRLGGPYVNEVSFHGAKSAQRVGVPVEEFLSWSNNAGFPELPDHRGALRLFRKLRSHPRLDRFAPEPNETEHGLSDGPATQPGKGGGHAQTPCPHAELHATNDKHRFLLDNGESARIENSTPRSTSTASSSTKADQPPCA